jgi:hypothetical protein
MSLAPSAETVSPPMNPFLAEIPPHLIWDNLSVEPSAEQATNELLPPSSPKALGALTVELALKSSAEIVSGARDPEQPKPYDVLQLKDLRDTFYFTNEKDKKVYGEVLLSENIPEWLLQSFGGKDVTPNGLIESFSATTVDEQTQETKSLVSDESLINLMQWHNHVQGEKQKVFETETIAPMRQRMMERVLQAEADGWLEPGTVTAERLDLINTTLVYIDDKMGIDNHFHGWMGQAQAYAHGRTIGNLPQIVMAAPTAAKFSQAKLEKVFTHEMVHVLTGYTPHVQSVDTYKSFTQEEADRKDTGEYGMRRLLGDNDAGTGLNEAVTEHFARALISGNIDKLQPLGGSYNGQRYLLRALCKRGEQPIDPRLFVQAMFADTPNSDRTITTSEPFELTELRAALSDAYPGRNIPNEMKNQLDVAAMAGGLVVGPVRKFAKAL